MSATDFSGAHLQGLSSSKIVLLKIAAMLAAVMQVLDMTIANVALPHMQAALGANQESVSWVLTSYIVASAIALPATGWSTVTRPLSTATWTIRAIGWTRRQTNKFQGNNNRPTTRGGNYWKDSSAEPVSSSMMNGWLSITREPLLLTRLFRLASRVSSVTCPTS